MATKEQQQAPLDGAVEIRGDELLVVDHLKKQGS
jgi:hypothetical protein